VGAHRPGRRFDSCAAHRRTAVSSGSMCVNLTVYS